MEITDEIFNWEISVKREKNYVRSVGSALSSRFHYYNWTYDGLRVSPAYDGFIALCLSLNEIMTNKH